MVYVANRAARTLQLATQRLFLLFKGKPSKRLILDREGGLHSDEYKTYLLQEAIPFKFVSSFKHAFNGSVERVIQTLRIMSRAALHAKEVDFKYWYYAVQHASTVKNVLPHSGLQFKSPVEVHYGTTPDYTQLRVFDCMVYRLQPHEVRKNKFLPITDVLVYLGDAIEATANTALLLSPATKRISAVFKQDVIFHERASYRDKQKQLPEVDAPVNFTKADAGMYTMEESETDDDTSDSDTAPTQSPPTTVTQSQQRLHPRLPITTLHLLLHLLQRRVDV